jgi:BirA family biotin operon repressor/biotin-[acetyl-CoA-carboxylase] ligase
MSTKDDLIRLLADGKFHSGQELGQQLNLSRTAIWKLITELTQLGLEINRLKGIGYQIPNGLELLERDTILSLLPKPLLDKISLEIKTEIDSTNQYLLTYQNSLPSSTIILAEHQTNGRGRLNRSWLSPYGNNIYFSILWRFDKDPTELSGLSLAAGVAVVNALEKYGISQLQLKWPNDILIQNKKLAGILIEMTGETNAHTQVILGIGINLSLSPEIQFDQPWVDLATILGCRPERNRIAAYLIQEVVEMLLLFQSSGFEAFYKHWQALDAFFKKPVKVITPQGNYFGVGNGINRQGEFILADEKLAEKKFLHGEVSLRLA